MTVLDHVPYGALWASFGVGHSLLAGASRHTGLGRVFGVGHRLAYNLAAAIHIALVYGIGRFVLARGHASWAMPRPVVLAMVALAVAGAGVVLRAVSSYDRAAFLGAAHLRGADGDDDAPLKTTGLNQHVRHPLYLGGLLLLWSGAMSAFGTATAILGTIYIVLGSCSEERRLVRRFGSEYSDYRRRFPALVPCGGRDCD